MSMLSNSAIPWQRKWRRCVPTCTKSSGPKIVRRDDGDRLYWLPMSFRITKAGRVFLSSPRCGHETQNAGRGTAGSICGNTSGPGSSGFGSGAGAGIFGSGSGGGNFGSGSSPGIGLIPLSNGAWQYISRDFREPTQKVVIHDAV